MGEWGGEMHFSPPNDDATHGSGDGSGGDGLWTWTWTLFYTPTYFASVDTLAMFWIGLWIGFGF